MKKDEQANVLLSLKNLYRLFTVKDYPVYSTGILGEKSKKGLTLVKFWDECLLYEWKSTKHGKMIFRKDGSQNRYHSEFCNRKESFPLYHIYIEEVLEGLNTETFGSQILIFEKFLKEKKELEQYIGKPTVTKDGVHIELVANIGKPEDLEKVLQYDGEGVGLFRTEFLFMDRTAMPTEEEQFEAYKSVAETMKGKPVIIRTLDIGGDKEIPYLGLEKEDNPFLGYRAIRFCLQRTDIYNTQLRALVRASAFGRIKIMVPLVTGVDELRSVKAMVADIMKELDAEGIAYNKNLEIGIMMETPAACMMADVLAKEAAFFSIGTNDLTGYTMAVDRGNSKVAYLYSAFNPAVLRAIKRIIECGKKEGIMVGMCGEAAADPKLIPLLLAFGLDEFSVSATSVLKTRKTIADSSMAECKALADKVMACATEAEVQAVLAQQ